MEKLKEIDDDICADAMGVVVFGRRREPRSLNALKRRCKSPSASENFPRGKLPKTKGGRKKVECNDVTERATILEYQAGLDVGGLVVKFDIHAVDVEVEDENHSANKLSRLHPNASSDQNCHQSHGILAHIQVTRSRYLISASISPSHRRTLGISSWAAAASSFVQRSNNLGGRFDEDKNSLDLLFRGINEFRYLPPGCCRRGKSGRGRDRGRAAAQHRSNPWQLSSTAGSRMPVDQNQY